MKDKRLLCADNIKDNIRFIREKRGLSKYKLWKRLRQRPEFFNMQIGKMTRLEQPEAEGGDKNFNCHLLNCIAEILDVSPIQFFRRTPNIKSHEEKVEDAIENIIAQQEQEGE